MTRPAFNLELKIPPPVVGLITATLMWGVAQTVWPAVLSVSGYPRAALALGLLVAGIATDIAGLIAFVRHKTTINPMRPGKTSHIVRYGIYRFSRNPMYLGMLLILSAWAVYLGHLLAALILPLFVAYINRFQIRPEERILAERFGADYLAYLASVRRWL